MHVLLDGGTLAFVHEQRRVQAGGAEHRLVAVVQVVACDAAGVVDRRQVVVKPTGVVEEDVALRTLEQERADLDRGRERQGLWGRCVQARDHCLQLRQLLHR